MHVSSMMGLRLFLYTFFTLHIPIPFLTFKMFFFSHLVRKDTQYLPPNEGFLAAFDVSSSGLPNGLSSLLSPSLLGHPSAQSELKSPLTMLASHVSMPPFEDLGIGLDMVYQKMVSQPVARAR